MRYFLAVLMLCASTAARADSSLSAHCCGKPVASGRRLDCRALTAAYRTLPFSTLARVYRIDGNCIFVRIDDRSPYSRCLPSLLVLGRCRRWWRPFCFWTLVQIRPVPGAFHVPFMHANARHIARNQMFARDAILAWKAAGLPTET